MTYQQMQVFAAIARTLSVTKAAKELHSSQSALSQHLKTLQQDYGRLTERKGRNIELTDRGRLFLIDIEPIVSKISAVERKYSQGPVAILKIGAILGPARLVLPELIERFRKDHQNVDVKLETGSSLDLVKLINSAKIDLAVIAKPFHLPSIEMEWFRKEKLAAFVLTDHPLAKNGQIHAQELATVPLIIRGGKTTRSSTDELLCALMARGIKFKVVRRLESADSVLTAVRKGEGAGILYYDMIKAEVERGEFKILRLVGLDLAADSYIAYARESSLSNLAKDFLKFLRAAKTEGISVKLARKPKRPTHRPPTLATAVIRNH